MNQKRPCDSRNQKPVPPILLPSFGEGPGVGLPDWSSIIVFLLFINFIYSQRLA